MKADLLGVEIMRPPTIAEYVADEFMPRPKVKTRADYEGSVLREGRSGYHPVGTFKMGSNAVAVVDPQRHAFAIGGPEPPGLTYIIRDENLKKFLTIFKALMRRFPYCWSRNVEAG